jgi:gluconokinase
MTTNGESAVVGIDLGTSAVKVLAVGLDGRTLALGSEFYGLETPEPFHVEQDADVVYRAAMRVLARVLTEVRLRGDDVAAIGFSSAMHGVLCVDDRGEPVSRALTWLDRRSAAIADAWRDDGTAMLLYHETGAPMHPMLPLCKIRWIADNDPALFARTHKFVGLKELFVHRWTGEWLVDWGIAAATGMFGTSTRAWSSRALELARIDPARLATPAPPSTARATFRPTIARELGLRSDAAVVLASSDGALANIGSGAAGGDLALTLGTSGAARTLTGTPVLDDRGRTFCYAADDRRYIAGGPTSSAGAALDWIFALLLDEVPKAERFARAVELAATVEPGSNGCTVLPFLSGERAPYWRSSLRGTLTGLDLAHDRRSILRAAFEGVVFGLFAVDAVLRERTGSAQRLLLSGGLTKAPFVRQLIADVFGIAAVQPHQEEASAFGAALLAAESRQLIDDAATVARGVGYAAAVEPDARIAPAYATAYARYRAAVDAQLSTLA